MNGLLRVPVGEAAVSADAVDQHTLLVLGHRFGSLLGKRLDVFGGLLLIALGTKLLFDHLNAT